MSSVEAAGIIAEKVAEPAQENTKGLLNRLFKWFVEPIGASTEETSHGDSLSDQGWTVEEASRAREERAVFLAGVLAEVEK